MDYNLKRDHSNQTINEEADQPIRLKLYDAIKAILTFVQMLFMYVFNGFSINLDKRNAKIWQNTNNWKSLKTSVILFERKYSVPKRFLYLFLFVTLAYACYAFLVQQQNTDKLLDSNSNEPFFKDFDINLNIFYITVETENLLIAFIRCIFTLFIFINSIGVFLILIYHFNKQNLSHEISEIWFHVFEIVSIVGGITCKVYKYLINEIDRGLEKEENQKEDEIFLGND